MKGDREKLLLSFSADHEQDWEPYPVELYSAEIADHTNIHMYIPRMHLQGHHGMFTVCLRCTSIPHVHLPCNMHINRCVDVTVQERLWTLT